MPHSGVRLVSRLLDGIGVDLGPIDDKLSLSNGTGRFTQLNDHILEAVNAAWNRPPPSEGEWVRAAELEPLRLEAADVAGALGLREPWGWADPRNSLTLPFWRELFPDLRLIVCVRDPREVAESLQVAGVMASEEALSLWADYYGTLTDEQGMVTDYDSFRGDAQAELERLARALGLGSSRVAITWTVAAQERPSTSSGLTNGELPRRHQKIYEDLLQASKARPSDEQVSTAASSERRTDLPEPLAAQRRELEHLRLQLARAHGQIEALRAQVEVRSLEPTALREVAFNLEQQLLERDEELERLRKAIWEGDVWRREMEAIGRQAEAACREADQWAKVLRAELDLIKSTRLWRAGKGYWALKARLRDLFRKGSS